MALQGLYYAFGSRAELYAWLIGRYRAAHAAVWGFSVPGKRRHVIEKRQQVMVNTFDRRISQEGTMLLALCFSVCVRQTAAAGHVWAR